MHSAIVRNGATILYEQLRTEQWCCYDSHRRRRRQMLEDIAAVHEPPPQY
jgi:hypothetical protein